MVGVALMAVELLAEKTQPKLIEVLPMPQDIWAVASTHLFHDMRIQT